MASFKFPVEASHILMFARSVGDDNQIYQDQQYAKGTEVGSIIAPPTFAQAGAQFDPNYTLRPTAGGDGWFGSGKNPSGAKQEPGGKAGAGLHAEQHFEYHRHPKPGDLLSVETKPGKSWEKQSKRAGKLSFAESITEYRDQNGELVITARSVSVVTERPVDQS